MNKKTKIILVLIFSFIVVNVSIFILIQINQTDRIDKSLNNHIEKLKIHYELLLNHQTKEANSIYQSTIELPDVINIISKANTTTSKDKLKQLRDELQSLLTKKYDRLKSNGLLQYHFIFPNNKVFLRMHKPSKFGDDLTNIREDFTYVNKTLKPITGFTHGRTAHGFRNVYPLFDKNNNHIGAMEISYSSEKLQDELTNISKIHTHFLVNKNIFDSKSWARNDMILKYIQSPENKNLMFTITKNHTHDECVIENMNKLKPVKNEIDLLISQNKPFSLHTFHEDSHVDVITFYPIKQSISKEVVAWLVSYEIDEFIYDTIKGGLSIRLVLFIVLLLLFYFIYRVLNQKEILDIQVKEQTQILTKKNIKLKKQSEVLTQTHIELEEREEDLKEINENLEQKIIIEVERNKKNQEQLFKSEKLAAMGEMIGNIAHQWRQPLSVISTAATGMKVQREYGILDDEVLNKSCDAIDKNAQYLSKTIDDFRNFIKGDKKVENFNLSEDINSFLLLIESSIKSSNIDVVLDLDDDINLTGLPNELIQCFINIFNNAKDALEDKNQYNKYIFITTYKDQNSINITFKDNAEGIDDNILPKIFEPYFTTKHQSQGTGLGLHMTYQLIVEGMKGDISVKNSNYIYNNKSYTGALFTISFPI